MTKKLSMPVDYRELLIKYIDLVGSSEGVTFINCIERGTAPYGWATFSPSEIDALKECKDIADKHGDYE